MITVADWIEVVFENGTFFYWRNDKVGFLEGNGWIKYDPVHKMFMAGPDNIWFKDIYKTEKECAEAMINQFKEMYL